MQPKNLDRSETRLAVLIDADNISGNHVQALMEEVTRFGIPTIKRIYGDWTKPQLSNWKSHLINYAISPIQQFGYTTGKNSTDSALIIDAMDILYSGRVDGFCLVSSDSDFTRLATRLREAGMSVIGIGEQKTPKAFINACNRFIFIDLVAASTQKAILESEDSLPASPKVKESSANARSNNPTKKIDASVRALVASSIEAVADDDGWAFLGDVGNMMLKKEPSFDPRNYGYAKLSNLVRNINRIEIDERPTTSPKIMHIFIRLR